MKKDVDSLSVTDIVEKIVLTEDVLITKKEIELRKEFIENFFSVLMDEVSTGNRVRVKNIGAFSYRLTKEEARNPSNNERVPVANRKRLRFEPSSSTIKKLNNL